MDREKYKLETHPQEIQKQSSFTPKKHLTDVQLSMPYSVITPKISNKMRQIIDEIRKTRGIQMRKKTYGGESKWIFKTQLKVVSQRLPQNLSEAYNKKATLTKIKVYINANQCEWQKESQKIQEKKAIFQQLLQTLSEQKAQKVKLKKKLVYCFIRNMKYKFLVNKNNDVDATIDQINHQNEIFKQLNRQIRTQIKNVQAQITEFQTQAMKKSEVIEQFNNQIANVIQQIRANDQNIRQISIKRLPNQKEICCCMFSVGILNEQLQILQLRKKLKNQVLPSDLQLRKVKNDGKQKQILTKNTSIKDLNEYIMHRKIGIDCRGSEIVVFKVFTVIYMHCKTLYLKNLSSIMSKTSFFAEEFKQIYDFQQFQKYMINLIERFKGNQTLLDKQQDPQNCSYGKLYVVANESQLRYLSWILKGFQYVQENKFCVRVGLNKTEITLLTLKQLSKMPEKEDKEAILRVKFCELNKTSAFD